MFGLKCWDKFQLPEDIQGQEAGRLLAAHHCSAPQTFRPGRTDQQGTKLSVSEDTICDGELVRETVMAGEEYEDYQYQDWGVDRVDLSFKSGPGLSCETFPVSQHTQLSL